MLGVNLATVKIKSYTPFMATSGYHHGDLKNALIAAGVKILAREGSAGLGLRNVAKEAGVSHSALYAHFTDKQALIAAISTEGLKQLYSTIEEGLAARRGEPAALLVEISLGYLRFALEEPDRFKLMYSSVMDKERDFPDFVDYSHRTFEKYVEVIALCQEGGILRPGPTRLIALSLWAAVHGVVMLALENQVPHALIDEYGLEDMLLFALNQMAIVKLKGGGKPDDSARHAGYPPISSNY
jgi:AcrR family transcriptional regulator